jgi:uncharacterized protein (DUF2126 family)
MSIHAALTHRTSYRYDRLVSLGPQTIRLRPAPHARTSILSYSLKVEPQPHYLNWLQDPQGNFMARVVFPERVEHFAITVDLVADMATVNPFDFFLEPEAETWPFSYDPVLFEELAPFRRLDPPGPLLQSLIASVPRAAMRNVDKLVALNRLISERIAYIVRMEPGVWSPEQTLSACKGSCRDSAWLLVHLLRHLGYAARFVSGYLIQLVADVKPLEGPEGPTSDFTDLHAWAEVYLPGAGWVGLDATSGLMAGEGHIPLAASPDPGSASPISGTVDDCETAFSFEMAVTRISETPRVTKPYTDRQWQDILATGHRVDRALKSGDVRLTMGGEPTFVSATELDAAEWNTDALGPTKRAYAGRLIRRLTKIWSPGSALQYAMGKQYPGEPLPRWALYSHWRTDNEPVWTDPGLFASDDNTGTATAQDAKAFCVSLAQRLQVDPSYVRPGFEDIHYYLWKEHRLPTNVVVEENKLANPLDRARMVRVFNQGLASEVGSVLPLRRVLDSGNRRWQSGHWVFRDGIMFLIPGDSPMGFRLPLGSLPWGDPDHLYQEFETDPFAPREPFPRAQALRRIERGPDPGPGVERFRPMAQGIPIVGPNNPRGEPDTIRTALTVESRGGIIHVFFPPLYAAEDWLALTAAVEQTAAELGQQVVLEGYLPPGDPRLQQFSVTPDPGVIEVNIHPASSWAEQVERTTQLYDEARQVGLATEKFLIDGKHVGTGGGNHVVMGAQDPGDSPFLRRPDLLKSLLGFWHNHPSLSYLFSGLFIGPTSQHSRIDEAREDIVNELEIAFGQIKPFQDVPPWRTDRMLRNILADMTGNTHRTEFCIDKMYSPDGAGGRRGLVEFRAFEMPPHAEMSLAQILLVRAAVAAFWNTPYERRLVRWGTRLHDEFMLPHYAAQDFNDVLGELSQFGFKLDPAWFAPHIAFRFPKIGEVTVRDAQVELRHALEPWHVLGEEQTAGGTARYVDSSAERVQVKVNGWVDERFVLACNGVGVPLQSTERQGEYVAGVRFKAWQPYSALHPTIHTQAPLVFDVYDRWSGRSLGGMTHQVVHPGGRSDETAPVNANAAEARRRARFFAIGHTAGPMGEPRVAVGKEHPRTLDLRRFA